MNPAFGAQESKAFVPLFSNTASKVRAEFLETPHVIIYLCPTPARQQMERPNREFAVSRIHFRHHCLAL